MQPQAERGRLQIALGAEYQHNFGRTRHGVGVIHGDLKPKNALVFAGRFNSQFHAVVKICDLGLSTGGEWGDDGLLSRRRRGAGTREYAAPELAVDAETIVTDRCDSWSLAMCLLHGIHGDLPNFIVRCLAEERGATFRRFCDMAQQGSSPAPGSAEELPPLFRRPNGELRPGESPSDTIVCGLLAECLAPEPSQRPNMTSCADRLVDAFVKAGGNRDFERPDCQRVLADSTRAARADMIERIVNNGQDGEDTLDDLVENLLLRIDTDVTAVSPAEAAEDTEVPPPPPPRPYGGSKVRLSSTVSSTN